MSNMVSPKLPNTATCLRWSPKGDLMAINSKGGKVSIFDIRKKDTDVIAYKCHDGPRAQKNTWIDD